MKYWVTKHCQERYVQRINNGLPVKTVDIIHDLVKGIDITNKIYDENPRYIVFLYEKYNSVSQKIIKSDKNIYILKKRKGTDALFEVLTCYLDKGKVDEFKNTTMSREDIFIRIKMLKSKLKNS